jgi:hypothetical protein
MRFGASWLLPLAAGATNDSTDSVMRLRGICGQVGHIGRMRPCSSSENLFPKRGYIGWKSLPNSRHRHRSKNLLPVNLGYAKYPPLN